MSARRAGEHGPGSRPLGQVESAGLLLDTQPSWCSRAALTSRRGEPGGRACAQNSCAAFGSATAPARGHVRPPPLRPSCVRLSPRRKRALRRRVEVRTGGFRGGPRDRAFPEEPGQKGRSVCANVSATCAINSQHVFFTFIPPPHGDETHPAQGTLGVSCVARMLGSLLACCAHVEETASGDARGDVTLRRASTAREAGKFMAREWTG